MHVEYLGAIPNFWCCKDSAKLSFWVCNYCVGVVLVHVILGATGPQVGTTVKYEPMKATDTLNKNGQSFNVNTLLHCITASQKYTHKSMEVNK
jgi:hypothetical protein